MPAPSLGAFWEHFLKEDHFRDATKIPDSLRPHHFLRIDGSGCSLVGQPFDPNIPIANDALRVVRLQSKSSLAKFAFVGDSRLGSCWFNILHHALAVDLYRDCIAINNDVLRPPFTIDDVN